MLQLCCKVGEENEKERNETEKKKKNLNAYNKRETAVRTDGYYIMISKRRNSIFE